MVTVRDAHGLTRSWRHTLRPSPTVSELRGSRTSFSPEPGLQMRKQKPRDGEEFPQDTQRGAEGA